MSSCSYHSCESCSMPGDNKICSGDTKMICSSDTEISSGATCRPRKRTAEAAGVAGTLSSKKKTATMVMGMPASSPAANKEGAKLSAPAEVAKQPSAAANKEVGKPSAPAEVPKPPSPAANKELAKPPSPNKAAGAVGRHAKVAAAVAKSPLAPKNREAAMLPPPSGAEDGEAQKQHLKAKCEKYRFIWKELQTVEEFVKNQDMFIEAFLKMDDDTATSLNDKIKKVRLAELRGLNRRWNMMMEVNSVFCKLMT